MPELRTKKELLVIDDEPMLCRMLSAFFSKRGFSVNTASTAHEAIEQIQRVKADVVLLDLKLPDSSGLDVLSEIKARFPDMRVVVISGMNDAPTIQEAMQRGASDYLAKPFDFSRCFYAAMGIEGVELATTQPQPEAVARVPEAVARQYQVLPIRWNEDGLSLAMADPLDGKRIEELRARLRCEIKPLGILDDDQALGEAISRCYGLPAVVVDAVTSDALRLATELIERAQAHRATDLHIGIGPEGPWIRERVDGLLHDVPVPPRFQELSAGIVARLKMMASLEIAARHLPQEGRIRVTVGSSRLDLRLSVLPTIQGESVAIRLLEPAQVAPLEQIGLSEEQVERLGHLLAKPQGMLLVTGPAESGKSMTLHACLAKLNTGKNTIVTIEDPVDYEQAGLIQMQVQAGAGLTFAAGLRAALRHDPDIVMVGELRDAETAGLAVRAALTGRLVLSTLHTNDAASGVTRLTDLGVEPFLLCSTLSGILSQRLVRKLCAACREPIEADAATLAPLGLPLPAHAGPLHIWRARGCAECRKTGYHGRTGIFELLIVDHHIRSLMIKRTSGIQIRQSAIANGMRSLLQSAWQQVAAGVTSLEELARVLPPDHR